MLKFNRVTATSLERSCFLRWPGGEAGGCFQGPNRHHGQPSAVPLSLGRRVRAGHPPPSIDKVWPKEEKGNDHAVWKFEYIAFFARPLNDNEITVKFWEVGGAPSVSWPPTSSTRASAAAASFSASITVAKPDFDTNKQYLMTIESGHAGARADQVLAARKRAEVQRQGRVQRRGSQTKIAVARFRPVQAQWLCRWSVDDPRLVVPG
jgi:hypothetical protein